MPVPFPSFCKVKLPEQVDEFGKLEFRFGSKQENKEETTPFVVVVLMLPKLIV